MASFTYAKKYKVTARCVSPLRTGGIGGDNDAVLLGSDGIPMIQAASIAGVLRSWFTDEGIAKELFGDSNNSKGSDRTSKVTVYDGLFQENVETQLRPRLRINHSTGAGEDGHKFELRSIPAGAAFTFRLLLKTENGDKTSETQLEEALSALNSGFLTFGGQYSNGFGIVELETVKIRSYDMTKAEDRMAWLTNEPCEYVLTLPDVKTNLVTFKLTGTSDHFLVKSGTTYKREIKKNEQTVKQDVTDAMKNPDGSYVLPGSSLKGVLRGRVERIAAYKNVSDTVDTLFGREAKGTDDNGLPGQLRVREFTLSQSKEQIITRTRLDRFTGGVLQKSLFTEKTLSDQITITVEVRKSDAKGNALLFYALRDMAMGMYAFGSESSVGRGFLNKESCVLTVSEGEDVCTFTFANCMKSEGKTNFVAKWLRALDKKDGN